ncbi:hypothetical protein PF005_g29239 [Phytophthora fragariae]|uniref:Uncharacterized protein n=2 Tax=Phytophthora TaxID=4783 RepID=A0A6A3DJA8_9STRA|nr:hypothetical protein PF003_g27658 [Phytophthora fragariae]KAE8998488.1 hypothetical protein PR002_g18727 [Phytophthora rubi]KAE8920453.1 hypothetical protein PF009_g29251 [Phytophthora fragariae]KAE8965382.1 hypothetical protein PF011_g28312 [Phytophthora fragariae]KAE9006571.1 hypothetical protein PR001_g17173 [Phytophthora rubi]
MWTRPPPLRSTRAMFWCWTSCHHSTAFAVTDHPPRTAVTGAKCLQVRGEGHHIVVVTWSLYAYD